MPCRTSIVGALTGILLLAGCTGPALTVLQQRWSEIPDCCPSLRDLPFEPIAVGLEKTFDVDDEWKAHEFEQGKSYFRAFVLPSSGARYVLHVASVMRIHRDLLTAETYFFAPRLTFLDAAFQPIRSLGRKAFSRPRIAPFAGTRMELRVELSSTGPERYVVLHTDAGELGLPVIEVEVPGMASNINAPTWVMAIERSRSSTDVMKAAPLGKLEVKVEGVPDR